MSIKYNEFGEVISVNGITTGQHLGAPMQDAIAEKDSDNKAYATQVNTVTRAENCVDDAQPTAGGGSGGGSGGSGGGGGKELIITVNDPNFGMDGRWNTIGAEANMSWADAKAAVLDGSLTKVSVLEYPGDEYGARIYNADIRSTSLDDGMSFDICIDFISVNHSGGSYIEVNSYSITWGESGDMMGTRKQIS